MKNENDPSASDSAATSPDGPKKVDSPCEADYLAQQQAQARAAISATIGDMKQAVVQSVSVREWTRRHPWILMGSAAAAGTVVGMLVTPTKEETFKEFFGEKWETIKDKFTPSGETEEVSGRARAKRSDKSSVFGTILHEVMLAAGPAITGLIAMMADKGNDEDGPSRHNGNGRHPPAEQPDPGSAV